MTWSSNLTEKTMSGECWTQFCPRQDMASWQLPFPMTSFCKLAQICKWNASALKRDSLLQIKFPNGFSDVFNFLLLCRTFPIFLFSLRSQPFVHHLLHFFGQSGLSANGTSSDGSLQILQAAWNLSVKSLDHQWPGDNEWTRLWPGGIPFKMSNYLTA